MTVVEYLLTSSERPSWLNYPDELIRLAGSDSVDLTPWRLCRVDAVRSAMTRLKQRLGRDLIPFGHRLDREDLACFEKCKGAMVLIIHDNTTRGWEDEGSFPTFADWLKDVEAEAEFWRE